MEVTCLGVALRQIIPKIVGEGLSSWWELVKPLVEFRWDVIMTRLNSMFELATQEEVSKSSNCSQSMSQCSIKLSLRLISLEGVRVGPAQAVALMTWRTCWTRK